MDALREFFTLQKIAYYAPPTALVVKPSAVQIYKLPPDTPRLRNTVLGYAEPRDEGETDGSSSHGSQRGEKITVLTIDF
jgi:hypothetical protein